MQLARIGVALAAVTGGIVVGSKLGAGGNAPSATSGALIGGGIGTTFTASRAATHAASPGVRALGMLGIGAGAFFAGVGASMLFGDRAPGSKSVGDVPPTPVYSPPSIPAPPTGYSLDDVVERGRADDVTAGSGTDTSQGSGTVVIEEESETYGPDGEWLGTEHGTLER